MSTVTIPDPYANASFLRSIVTSLLHGLHKVLPSSVYNALYNPAFALYQAYLRYHYRHRLNLERALGNYKTVVCMERVSAVMNYSLVGTRGLEHTHNLAQDAVDSGTIGAFVECGVARGGCAALIGTVASSAKTPRNCWFFDSYEGLPDPTTQDFHEGRTGRHVRPLPKGSCLGTYESVSTLLFETFRLDRNRVRMVKGWFQDTLPAYADEIGPIALLRIDGDWYDSTKCCLETLYPQVASGGHVIIDDYFSCFGARKATDEFLQAHLPQAELVADGRGGASFRKDISVENMRNPS